MKTLRTLAVLAGLGAALLLTGCADTRQTRVERDMGTSQRLAVFNQTLNPEAGKNLEPVEGIDSQAADRVMDKYRTSFEKPAKAGDVTINIGQ
jgi:type IV pilus biogenesis protein CpaD/CtpE